MKKASKNLVLMVSSILLLSLTVSASAQRLNKLIELFENDQPAFGVLSFDYSLNNARAMASSGLDFLFIDMEHAPFDIERLRLFLLGMTDKRSINEKGNLQPNVVPLVRIPAAGGAEELIAQAKQVLDVGVFGIFFPAVHTREQAELAVRATRYPQYNDAPDYEPAGLRGRNPSNAMWYWGVRDYHARADVWPLDPQGELLAMMFIESRAGVENIEEIITVPGLGGIFIGPSDLSTSMGYTSPAAPEVEQAIQTVLGACLEHDVPCAITTGQGSVQQRIDQGFRFVTVGADGGLNTGASNALRLGREAAGR
ncbi:MAG: aldolase/citrate lyase family protein [Gammaproteobacteria bacterium]|jgi:4-hydroxy-2-oxoheptanedioate aldolase|nr:aldolase/citrate lyase family protein [Pseudomonadales bacterium]MCS5579846.1 aldolase/citrate lyase family protein [Gammaproteobacteria bacterium]MEC9223370.1 aldolase/citrate lyase family protein [Pseudomonadota bacterium]MEE2608745.1 aldolase/citrate lyase family protein [Pseudomonadota bacterium]MEE3171980.1 aldolase/citrate lyase family protein [Pseudomonadota bacterium]|tara:strand:- start:918 stop:1850 length:933 start_codon:yes stop_codon:yes gene_type:complete